MYSLHLEAESHLGYDSTVSLVSGRRIRRLVGDSASGSGFCVW